MKAVLSAIGVVVAFFALIVFTSLFSETLSLKLKQTFGVANVNADRKIFEESQPYNESMARDLENIQQQYIQATPEQKASLKALALHRFSVYPEDRLTPEQRRFYSQLKGGF